MVSPGETVVVVTLAGNVMELEVVRFDDPALIPEYERNDFWIGLMIDSDIKPFQAGSVQQAYIDPPVA